jgi:hypothetical protein
MVGGIRSLTALDHFLSPIRVPVVADGMGTLKTWSFGIRLPEVGDKELVRVAKPKAVQGVKDVIGDPNALIGA